MDDRGFVMVVGSSDNQLRIVGELLDKYGRDNAVLVYSCWDGYYKYKKQIEANPNYKRMRDLFGDGRCVDIHTGGHANREALEEVISYLCPRDAIVGIHKERGTSLGSLNIDDSLKSRLVPESFCPDWIEIKE